MKCKCVRPTCFYCEAVLSPRHEHDHWPKPKRNGGQGVVPICLNCHDLKDRVPLGHWPDGLWVEAWKDAGPLGRILIGKCAAMFSDVQAERGAA